MAAPWYKYLLLKLDKSKAAIESLLTGAITSHTHPGGAGSGDVVGPATNSADYLPQWDGANSKILKNGLAVPAGGLAGITALNVKTDLATVKADTDIASAISLKHASGSDNQDLSGLQATLVSATNIKTINGVTVLGSGDLAVTGASEYLAKLVLAADKATAANVTPVTLGLSFNYIANKKYIIDIYALVAPTAATTGCGFLIDVSTAVTYVGTFVSHQLAVTGTISGAGSVGDKAATSSGISSGMVLAAAGGSNFVYGGGILVTGANAGTAEFFFRSETTAVTTCKAGTVIRVMEV